MVRFLLLVAWLASLSGLVGPTIGTNRGALTGRVIDISGAPFIGAVVQIGETGLTGMSIAPRGDFRIDSIPAGVHFVTISATGHGTPPKRRIVIAADSTVDIGTVTLEILEAKPDEFVPGPMPKLITGTEVIEKKSRSAAMGNRYSIRGGRATETDIRVDGVTADDPYAGGPGAAVGNTHPTESELTAKEVQVVPSPISAEYGDVIGGMANSVPVGPETQSSYATETDRDAGPTDRRSETFSPIYENAFLPAHANPISTFSIDVDRASYSTVRSYVNGGMLPPADAVRIEELVNYFDYSYPEPADEHPLGITSELSECPWDRSHRLVRIGLQGTRMNTGALPPSNLTFLIDVSGSMSAMDKLPLLQSGLGVLVDQLREQDSVAIVVYAGAAGLVLPMTSGREKQQIRDAIDALQAGGSTAGGAGINLAYTTARASFRSDANNRVILATDGDFNVGISSEEELVSLIEERRKEGIFLTVLGFGTDDRQDSKMEQLADHGNGNYYYVDDVKEARKVFVNELGGTLVTIAKDVKIQVFFSPQRVESYRLIGYENRMLATEDFDDDTKDAGELGAGHSVTALYEIVPRGAASPSLDGWSGKPDTLDMPGDWQEGEMMRVRLRYKLPDADVSSLVEGPVIDRGVPLERTTPDFRFAAAVAEFGMILRNSTHKGGSNLDNVLWLAKAGMAGDPYGYRKEFVEIVEKVRGM